MTNKTCNYLQDIHDNWNYLDIHEIHSGHIYQQGNISAIVQHNVLSYYECDNGRLAKQLFDTFYVLILLWEYHLEIKYKWFWEKFRNFLHYLMPYIGPNWQIQLEDNAISSFWEQSIHMVCKYHYLFYRSWSNWRNCWILHFRFLEQGTFDNLFIACFIPPNSHFGTMIRHWHWIIEYLFWNSSLTWFFPSKLLESTDQPMASLLRRKNRGRRQFSKLLQEGSM